MNASKTLGANRTRLIFTHLLPNISGKLMVRFVNQIPKIIFFETSLVFLGLKAPTDASLGTMIETARQTGYVHLLLAPTLIIVIITLCSQIIANAFNDSLDPRVIGK
ncbi:MAG: ABC transporter permease subunit [Cetobacterium sp.]